jgi:putative endonuclease
MTYYVYMLKNIDRFKSKTYVGFTNNLVKRLNLHNNNKGAKSTKGYKWIVIYKKRFINKSKALSYEYALKKNRKLRTQILNDFKQ